MFDLFGTKKEGPGVYLDTPRKTGPGRFFEILFRDFGSMYYSAFLASLSFAPLALGTLLTVLSKSVVWALVFGLVGGLIASPCYAVLVDTILRAQRDEPGYWWVRYRKAFKNNFKASLLPGAIFGVILTMQALYLCVLLPANLTLIMIAALTVSTLVTSFLFLWTYPQIVLFNLPLTQVLRNAAILAFSQLPRSFGGAALAIAYWAAILLFYPLSTLVFLISTLWLPTFLALSVIYVPLNKTFDLEKLVEEKRVSDAAQEPRYFSKERHL